MKTYLSILFIFLMTCTQDKNDKHWMEKFNSLKNQVDKKLTNHFPNFLDSNNLLSVIIMPPINSEYNEGLELSCFVEMDDGKLYRIVDSLNQVSISTISMNDSSIIMVDRPYNTKNRSIDSCQYEKIPLPHFTRWENNYSPDRRYIPQDLTFYILDAEPGQFLADTLITKGGGLPKKWENGFSKGVSISREESFIVYWLIVW